MNKNTYSLSFFLALIINLILVCCFYTLEYINYGTVNFKNSFLVFLFTFIFSYVLIQSRVEKFIYKRIRKIYDNVSRIDVSKIDKNPIHTDVETLTEEVRKFTEGKQIEIESLNERENYRREFLGNVSHELKTPLFTVQGYILTLLEGAANDKQIRTRYLERANKGVERLEAIIKDLDMISKLESNNFLLEKRNFDCVNLVQNTFDLLEMKAKKKNIQLKFDKPYEYPEIVFADEERIEQVLINLVVNAIKYGKAGGQTIVSIQNTEANKISISVADDGIGIDTKDINRIFERFYRADKSRSREQGGSGLGLSIVKHIIEAHGEKIFIRSVPDKGSVFSFTLSKA